MGAMGALTKPLKSKDAMVEVFGAIRGVVEPCAKNVLLIGRDVQQPDQTENVIKINKVLIVDYGIRNFFAMTYLLQPYNMQINSAETGEIALSHVQSSQDIDVVLMFIFFF